MTKIRHADLLRLYTSAPNAFWRHDVDVSPASAVQMARFARLAGVKTMFSIMTRSELYNPFARETAALIREIHSLGHRLVPHVDCRPGDDIWTTVKADRILLAHQFPGLFDPGFVSFHMPSKELLWRDFEGFDHAHAARWKGRYVADSRGEWPKQKAERVADDMQICLHPEYWFY